jgi:hypothetical protein
MGTPNGVREAKRHLDSLKSAPIASKPRRVPVLARLQRLPKYLRDFLGVPKI